MSQITTFCHAWVIVKTNNQKLGFTDHDRPLSFDGLTFKPQAGGHTVALQQSSGLSIDNTEAIGVLSDDAISERDIKFGLYDGAEVQSWRVNWQNPSERYMEFRGTISEITQKDGAFHAELQGIAAGLNRPIGRVYQKPCSAVLGTEHCGVDLGDEAFSTAVTPLEARTASCLMFDGLARFASGWFSNGLLEVTYDHGATKCYPVKNDTGTTSNRKIDLWHPVLEPDHAVTYRLIAGCDKRFTTCSAKFKNALNFQGFPDIPSQDWMLIHPTQSSEKSGGTRR